METIAIVALISAFLPFLVSLGGRGGIWKFLSFAFCCFAVAGAASVVGFGGGIVAWVIAWIFTAIAAQSRRSEERFARMERNMMAANAAERASSPVERLLQAESENRSFVSPGRLVALILVFGLAAALIVTALNDTKTSNNQAATGASTSTGAQTVAAIAPQKVEAPSAVARKCQVSDFAIEGFTSKVFDDCKQSSCPTLKLTGRLKNNCTNAAGAQIKITAEDGKGNVVDTTDGWPASTRNIGPAATYAFDMGPLLTYRKTMKKFSVEIVDVKTW